MCKCLKTGVQFQTTNKTTYRMAAEPLPRRYSPVIERYLKAQPISDQQWRVRKDTGVRKILLQYKDAGAAVHYVLLGTGEVSLGGNMTSAFVSSPRDVQALLDRRSDITYMSECGVSKLCAPLQQERYQRITQIDDEIANLEEERTTLMAVASGKAHGERVLHSIYRDDPLPHFDERIGQWTGDPNILYPAVGLSAEDAKQYLQACSINNASSTAVEAAPTHDASAQDAEAAGFGGALGSQQHAITAAIANYQATLASGRFQGGRVMAPEPGTKLQQVRHPYFDAATGDFISDGDPSALYPTIMRGPGALCPTIVVNKQEEDEPDDHGALYPTIVMKKQEDPWPLERQPSSPPQASKVAAAESGKWSIVMDFPELYPGIMRDSMMLRTISQASGGLGMALRQQKKQCQNCGNQENKNAYKPCAVSGVNCEAVICYECVNTKMPLPARPITCIL